MEKSFLILSVLMPTLINFLHVPSFILGARAQTDIDIACGATESFTDPVYGMQWVDDDKFIEYGSTDVVKFTSPDATFLSTVRYFQDRSMINYCYTIPGVTKGNNITVIAIFLYGNYDSLALPPSFRLQMDGSEWAEVETSMDAELVVYGKTYWAVANDVSLCLARDSAQDSAGDPFISAIQIREAPPSPSTEPPPSPSTEPPPSNSSTKPPPSNASTKPFPPVGFSLPFPNISLPKPTRLPPSVLVGVKAAVKRTVGGFIYLVTLLPGGSFITLLVTAITCIKKRKKNKKAHTNNNSDAAGDRK